MPASVAARPSLKADALLLSVTLMAAAGWIFSKEALEGLPPLLFIGTRFLLAALLLGAVGWRSLLALDAGQWRPSCAVGGLFIGAITLWVLEGGRCSSSIAGTGYAGYGINARQYEIG